MKKGTGSKRDATGTAAPMRPTTGTAKHERLPMCFVIMPFGKKGTEQEAHYRLVYEHIITRAVNEAGFECERADEIPDSGPVPEEVKKRLRTAHLVLADLSDKNPNVFYELGYRHAMNKAIVTISDDVSSIPFNLSPYRTIEYTIENLAGADQARDKIRDYALAAARQLKAEAKDRAEDGASRGHVSVARIEAKLDQGFSNVYELVSKGIPFAQETRFLAEVQAQSRVHEKMQATVEAIQAKAEAMVTASRLLQQTADYGLVSIYPTRLDAIEEQFFKIMEREEREIDIVGSTIFGLQGRHDVTRDKLLELLKFKARQDGFMLKILLTHWEYISHRQNQEKTDKNITRYVISKELKEAVDLLKYHGLAESVRFYLGAPTCFTVICRGQGMMLANPYPYEKEAYNSWTVLFRETGPRCVYEVFTRAHFDQPWANARLCVSFNDACREAVEAKLRQDLEEAQREMAATYKQEDK